MGALMSSRSWALFAVLVLAIGGMIPLITRTVSPVISRPPPEAAIPVPSADFVPGGEGCRRPIQKDIDRCRDAAEQSRLQRSDLVQQKRAADAATLTAEFTASQAYSAAVQAVLGWLTLCAATAAAIYSGLSMIQARRAAVEARRSVTAFVEAERGRVIVHITGADESQGGLVPGQAGLTLSIGIRLENVGRSVAVLREISIGKLGPDRKFPSDRSGWRTRDLGSKTVKPEEGVPTSWMRLPTTADEGLVQVGGFVRYQTQFGQDHFTYFTVEANRMRDSGGGNYTHDVNEGIGNQWPRDC
jgi:hypothetical protein